MRSRRKKNQTGAKYPHYKARYYQQDGGIGTYTFPPRTTTRRATTNLKTRNNQNCKKIQLYKSPATKELNKKPSSRLVGAVEMGSQGREDSRQGGCWWNREGEEVAGGAGSPTFA